MYIGANIIARKQPGMAMLNMWCLAPIDSEPREYRGHESTKAMFQKRFQIGRWVWIWLSLFEDGWIHNTSPGAGATKHALHKA